jgi:sec-independent protein translocase protein TatB
MFGLGWGELVVIGIVALIAVGPKELPTVLRTLGQAMAKVRRMANEFQGQFQEALREAEFADLKKEAEDLTSSVTDFSSIDPMADVEKEMKSAFEPSEPAKLESATTETAAAETSGPTPEPEAAASPDATPPVAAASHDDAAPAKPPPKQAGGSA